MRCITYTRTHACSIIGIAHIWTGQMHYYILLPVAMQPDNDDGNDHHSCYSSRTVDRCFFFILAFFLSPLFVFIHFSESYSSRFSLCSSFMLQHTQQQQQQKCTRSHSYSFTQHSYYLYVYYSIWCTPYSFILSLVFSWWLLALTRWSTFVQYIYLYWSWLRGVKFRVKSKRKHSNIKRKTITKLNILYIAKTETCRRITLSCRCSSAPPLSNQTSWNVYHNGTLQMVTRWRWICDVKIAFCSLYLMLHLSHSKSGGAHSKRIFNEPNKCKYRVLFSFNYIIQIWFSDRTKMNVSIESFSTEIKAMKP